MLFAAGFSFAAIVINPNYTRRRSWYIKKMNCVLFGLIGTQWAIKLQNEAILELMLRNYDYFPHEVKRTLATKDHRYMVDFNYQNPVRPLFDAVSGKALS